MNTTACMLDLETFGTTPDAAIVSIGACTFDPRGSDIGEMFYKVIDLDKSSHPGRMSASTISWWLQQSEAARQAITQKGYPMGAVLAAFELWVARESVTELWSNGPTFDEIILRSAFSRYGRSFPLNYWDSRCMRTLKGLRGAPPAPDRAGGVAHNALDDALHQARHVQLIFRTLGL